MNFTSLSTLGMSLEKELQWLANLSLDPNGGISRLLYTPSWVKTQYALKEAFEEKMLQTSFDNVGNLFGRLEGTVYKNETILTGSHIDTVKSAGVYDGQFGIIAGLFALTYLKEAYGQPLRNIEVVSMAEEEGSRFPYTFWGSKNIVGCVDQNEVKNLTDADGISFNDAIKEAGFTYQTSENVRDDLKAFIELHVEQGNVLENEEKQVGIVNSIVGQRRLTVNIKGQANHAGTTPMGYRIDAMNVVSRIAVYMNDLALIYGDPLVATIGHLTLEPNINNVIPGEAKFTIDIRHTDKDILNDFTKEIEAAVKGISEKHGASAEVEIHLSEDPIKMDTNLVKRIQDQCRENNINYKIMHSGAGHDAQIFAAHIPTALIFVPSHQGLSHSSKEYTKHEDLAVGVQVLIHSLYELSYKE